MGPIYQALGLTVGVIPARSLVPLRSEVVTSDIRLTSLRPSRARSLSADITLWARTTEFGFDTSATTCVQPDELVQRELHYAIVDEVDSS